MTRHAGTRYWAEGVFALDSRLVTPNLNAGPVTLEVGDEEAVIALNDPGVLICVGVVSQTYTSAARDAVTAMRLVLTELTAWDGLVDSLPDLVALAITEPDAYSKACIEHARVPMERG